MSFIATKKKAEKISKDFQHCLKSSWGNLRGALNEEGKGTHEERKSASKGTVTTKNRLLKKKKESGICGKISRITKKEKIKNVLGGEG